MLPVGWLRSSRVPLRRIETPADDRAERDAFALTDVVGSERG